MLAFAGSTACVHTRATQTALAVEWSLGSSRRIRSAVSPQVLLTHYDPARDGHGTGEALSECVRANSLLPAPFVLDDPRIFLAVQGQLFVQDISTGEYQRLAGLPRGLLVDRLLGYDGAQSPLRMLVTAGPLDESLDLWVLEIGTTEIESAYELSSSPTSRVQARFFDRFEVPRCQSGASNCVVVNNDEQFSHLDLEPERGSPRTPMQTFEHVRITDATWDDAAGQGLYLLVADCAD